MTAIATWVDQTWRRGIAPPPRLTVSQWADRYRILPNTSAEPGPWHTDRTPYLREIMDCLSATHPAERVVFMKGAQVGGTEVGLNWIGYVIHHAPGLMLMVQPTLDMLHRNTRTRIDPLIESTPEVRDRVVQSRGRDSGNTATRKKFVGGELVMTGATSPTGLRSTPARYLFLDEVDGFPPDAGGEGDPVALAIQRAATFRGRRKIFLVSTPTIVGNSRIEAAFEESDQRRLFLPCPSCGEFQVLAWANVKWPAGRPQEAYYRCPAHGCAIEERAKPEMLRAGEWRPTAPGDGRSVGFHLSTLYSPFESWAEIATEFQHVHRDPPRLQVWVNTKLGESWEDRSGEAPPPGGLEARLEDWGPDLPTAVVVLTAGVDVQPDRLEVEVVGWGRGEESWSIAHEVLQGDASGDAVWRELDELLQRKFKHAAEGLELTIRACCVDSGGHNAMAVYTFCGPRLRRRIFAIKGQGGEGKPAWPRRATHRTRDRSPLFLIGVDTIKEAVYARLKLTEPGPGYCHFPSTRAPEYFDQLVSERMITKFVKGRAKREWHKRSGQRNEALDLRVYAVAALHALHAAGLNLEAEAEAIEVAALMSPNQRHADFQSSARQTIRSRWMQQP